MRSGAERLPQDADPRQARHLTEVLQLLAPDRRAAHQAAQHCLVEHHPQARSSIMEQPLLPGRVAVLMAWLPRSIFDKVEVETPAVNPA